MSELQFDHELLVSAVANGIESCNRRPKDGNSLLSCRGKPIEELVLTVRGEKLFNVPEFLQEQALLLGRKIWDEEIHHDLYLLNAARVYSVRIEPITFGGSVTDWNVTGYHPLVLQDLDDMTLWEMGQTIQQLHSAYAAVRKAECDASTAADRDLGHEMAKAVTRR